MSLAVRVTADLVLTSLLRGDRCQCGLTTSLHILPPSQLPSLGKEGHPAAEHGSGARGSIGWKQWQLEAWELCGGWGQEGLLTVYTGWTAAAVFTANREARWDGLWIQQGSDYSLSCLNAEAVEVTGADL